MMIGSNIYFPHIKGMTFGLMARKGDFASEETFESFDKMREHFNFNTVILPVTAWQNDAVSTEIYFGSSNTVSEWEIENMVDYSHKKGLRVLLKPIVRLIDGALCADINFVENGFPDKSLWSKWFKNYKMFVLHMAGIAQDTGCSFFSVGCGLTQSERYEDEWRLLIAAVRQTYDGFITYNTEKSSEKNLAWLDALDMILPAESDENNAVQTNCEQV